MNDDKTNWIWTNNEGAQGVGRDEIPGFEDESTRRIQPTGIGTATDMQADSDRTSFVNRPSGGSDPADSIDPVTGWFVIVQGPGLGRSLVIGPGRSSLGRGEDQRISFPFGDRSMSRNHAQIVYDPGSRKFHISEGDGTSLTRINGELLIGNAILKGGELIELGEKTHVRFVPFCSDRFDWSDLGSEKPDEKDTES